MERMEEKRNEEEDGKRVRERMEEKRDNEEDGKKGRHATSEHKGCCKVQTWSHTVHMYSVYSA